MHTAYHSVVVSNGFALNDKMHKNYMRFYSLIASRTKPYCSASDRKPSANIHGQSIFMHFACKRHINRNFNWFSQTHTQKTPRNRKGIAEIRNLYGYLFNGILDIVLHRSKHNNINVVLFRMDYRMCWWNWMGNFERFQWLLLLWKCCFILCFSAVFVVVVAYAEFRSVMQNLSLG